MVRHLDHYYIYKIIINKEMFKDIFNISKLTQYLSRRCFFTANLNLEIVSSSFKSSGTSFQNKGPVNVTECCHKSNRLKDDNKDELLQVFKLWVLANGGESLNRYIYKRT